MTAESVEALLNEDEASLYAEWVNLHTGEQTMVVSQLSPYFAHPSWAVQVVTETGGRWLLRSRRAVARYVNRKAQSDG